MHMTMAEMNFVKDIVGKICITAGVCFVLYLAATPAEVRFAGKAFKKIVKSSEEGE